MLWISETLGLCLFFWLMCYLGTGTDEKNVKSYRSYPEAVQKMLRENKQLSALIPKASPLQVFFSNAVLFTVVLLILGLPLRQSLLSDFLHILAMGQMLNAFDFFIMDLIWFRHTKRTRFTGTKEDEKLYADPRNHFAAFLRGIPVFFLAALIDALLLNLI